MSLRRFAANYAIYVGGLMTMLVWWLVFQAWVTGNWTLMVHFNTFEEGLIELIAFTVTITLLPYGWYALGER